VTALYNEFEEVCHIDLLAIPTEGRAVACNADMKIMMFVKALCPPLVFRIRM
jgi:hypothetical protein